MAASTTAVGEVKGLVEVAGEAMSEVPNAGVSGILLFALIALVTVAVAGRLSKMGARMLMRLGVGSEHELGQSGRVVQWGLLVVGGLFLARELLTPLPGWALSLSVLGILSLILVATGTLSDLLGGGLAQFRFGLQEGDQLRVGSSVGEVRALRLGRIALRTQDGQQLIVPGRRVLSEVVEVAPLRRAYPVELSVGVPRPLQEAELTILRERLLLMPYRVPTSPMHISQQAGAVHVQCQVWQQAAVTLAERCVRQDCAELSKETSK